MCDVYSKLDHLKKVRDDIIHDLKFEGSIQIVESNGKVPREFYDVGLVVGATNVPDVLDIEHLNPGTLIVDDSGPHCFSPAKAIQRFEAHEDILFTAGGVLRLFFIAAHAHDVGRLALVAGTKRLTHLAMSSSSTFPQTGSGQGSTAAAPTHTHFDTDFTNSGTP